MVSILKPPPPPPGLRLRPWLPACQRTDSDGLRFVWKRTSEQRAQSILISGLEYLTRDGKTPRGASVSLRLLPPTRASWPSWRWASSEKTEPRREVNWWMTSWFQRRGLRDRAPSFVSIDDWAVANPIENQQYARYHKTEINTEAGASLYLHRHQREWLYEIGATEDIDRGGNYRWMMMRRLLSEWFESLTKLKKTTARWWAAVGGKNDLISDSLAYKVKGINSQFLNLE